MQSGSMIIIGGRNRICVIDVYTGARFLQHRSMPGIPPGNHSVSGSVDSGLGIAILTIVILLTTIIITSTTSITSTTTNLLLLFNLTAIIMFWVPQTRAHWAHFRAEASSGAKEMFANGSETLRTFSSGHKDEDFTAGGL